MLRHKPETLPGKRDNVSPYEQNKIIWLVENRNVFSLSPYEKALRLISPTSKMFIIYALILVQSTMTLRLTLR